MLLTMDLVVRELTWPPRSTETIGAMLHNRQEIITVDKFKKGVEQMLRRNFSVDMLKRIRTVFPAAYRWQHF